MAEHHDAKTVGHYGIEQTLELIQRDFWWKGMRQTYCPLRENLPYMSNDEIGEKSQEGLMSSNSSTYTEI